MNNLRAVFDRMVAADEQIKEAQQAHQMHALFADAQTAGMSEQDFMGYFKDAMATTDKAITDIQSRALADLKYMCNARHRDRATCTTGLYLVRHRQLQYG